MTPQWPMDWYHTQQYLDTPPSINLKAQELIMLTQPCSIQAQYLSIWQSDKIAHGSSFRQRVILCIGPSLIWRQPDTGSGCRLSNRHKVLIIPSEKNVSRVQQLGRKAVLIVSYIGSSTKQYSSGPLVRRSQWKHDRSGARRIYTHSIWHIV